MNIVSIRLLPVLTFVLILISCTPSQKTTVEQQTVSAPVAFRKLMVFAHIEDSFNRRMVEVGIAQALEQKGIQAYSTYRSINGIKESTAATIGRTALAMGADGLLVVTNAKAAEAAAEKTAFGPIHFGPSIPLTGGITQGEVLYMMATLHRRGVQQPVWRMEFSQKVGDNIKLLGDAINAAVVEGVVKSGAAISTNN